MAAQAAKGHRGTQRNTKDRSKAHKVHRKYCGAHSTSSIWRCGASLIGTITHTGSQHKAICKQRTSLLTYNPPSFPPRHYPASLAPLQSLQTRPGSHKYSQKRLDKCPRFGWLLSNLLSVFIQVSHAEVAKMLRDSYAPCETSRVRRENRAVDLTT